MNLREHCACKPFRGLLFVGVSAMCALVGACTVAVGVPAAASAYAAVEGPPVFSSAVGLPDGRVYEQVSPADKNGNEAGAKTVPEVVGAEERFSLAAADGNSVLFEGTGPMGEVATAINPYFVATKSASGAGWTTRAITPAPRQSGQGVINALNKLELVDPSADLSHVMFRSSEGAYAAPPDAKCDGEAVAEGQRQLYLSGSDPFVPATWLERPEIANAIENCNGEEVPVGGSPDFSTVYFAFAGTLLPEDAARVAGSGFYEYREGVLREAGVLPDNHLDSFGATPAGSASDGAVSADGSRAFFVSPESCEQGVGAHSCAVDPPELYVRESGERTLLVSRDTLLPEVGGLPALAPADPAGSAASFAFASPDGSQAFFQSEDALTKAAEEVSPGGETKTYDFNVSTGTLVYMPHVLGRILATDTDGSSLAFEAPTGPLELWSAGASGGSVAPIVAQGGVSEARMSSDGSVLVFATTEQLAGFNNGGTHPNGTSGGLEPGSVQIYRYDSATNALGCVSCPPLGVTPSGNASMSPLQTSDEELFGHVNRGVGVQRGISSDGSRVFFDTPDPLVSQDTNTGLVVGHGEAGNEDIKQGGRDVYEWENGVVYLISSGKSTNNSYFLDNSESGDDVFFATTDGLVPGDTDGAYDVYDARVPRVGDSPPPAAVPCEGSVCQGPPQVSSPLTTPVSAVFAGLGNPAPEPAVAPAVKPKPAVKVTRCKKGFVRKKGRCVKRPKPKRSSHGRGSK